MQPKGCRYWKEAAGPLICFILSRKCISTVQETSKLFFPCAWGGDEVSSQGSHSSVISQCISNIWVLHQVRGELSLTQVSHKLTLRGWSTMNVRFQLSGTGLHIPLVMGKGGDAGDWLFQRPQHCASSRENSPCPLEYWCCSCCAWQRSIQPQRL